MENSTLHTPIDDIVTYVKSHPGIGLKDLSSTFKVNETIMDRWVSVLEEEGIFRVELHNLESKVYFEEKQKQTKEIKVENIKERFVQACYHKKISTEKTKELWRLFFEEYEDEIRQQFEKESREKKFDSKKIPLAWKRFRESMKEL
jgi:DNA-binding transcriptional regulator YhcF (GntR family)